MTDYRDFGQAIRHDSSGTIVGREPSSLPLISTEEPTTQVYKVTHVKKDGVWQRETYIKRSFISFSFGGKWIEDFGFIASIDGDRMQLNATAEFKDNVTSDDVTDGQIYWGTHYNTNSRSFSLATDGITENELLEFQNWFAPGNMRELILSEHPNRAIIARISEVPQLQVIPFEKKITKKIGGIEYESTITLYRGTASLTFVMDDPFWYSINNIISMVNNDGTLDWDYWINTNGQREYIYDSPDTIKIITEDGVPTVSMMNENIQFGIGYAASTEDADLSRVDMVLNEDTGAVYNYNTGAGESDATLDSTRIRTGLVLKDSGVTIGTSVSPYGYLYYAGTAPAKPILSFTLTPTFTNYYISVPANSFVNSIKPYNTLTLESVNERKEFKFSTPSIFTGYNQIIKIFKDSGITNPTTLRKVIRETVQHSYARDYGISVLDDMGDTFDKNVALQRMIYFVKNNTPIEFTFNSETGEAIGTFSVAKEYKESRITDEEQVISIITVANEYEELEENIGDMVRSDYLIIKERNYPTSEGYIEQWDSEESKLSTYRISSDIKLENVIFKYRYMYL